jgi:hypothetical protein
LSKGCKSARLDVHGATSHLQHVPRTLELEQDASRHSHRTRMSPQSRTTQRTTLTDIVLDLASSPSLYSCLCLWLDSRNRRAFKSEASQPQAHDKQYSYPTFLPLNTNFMGTSAIFVQPWVSWAIGHVAHHPEMDCQISSSSIRRTAHDRVGAI